MWSDCVLAKNNNNNHWHDCKGRSSKSTLTLFLSFLPFASGLKIAFQYYYVNLPLKKAAAAAVAYRKQCSAYENEENLKVNVCARERECVLKINANVRIRTCERE